MVDCNANMQKEKADERALAMSVGPDIQRRLVNSLLNLLYCEIPLEERTIAPSGFRPTTPQFQTFVQGLCLLARSILIWERSSRKGISSQKGPATQHASLLLHAADGQESMSESSRQSQEQWREGEREFAWSFCYKSFLYLVGPSFLKLLRGESAVGSVITGW